MGSIEASVITHFQNQTQETLSPLINKWRDKCDSWLNDAYNFMYSSQHVSELKKFSKFHFNKTAAEYYKAWINNQEIEILEQVKQQALQEAKKNEAYESLENSREKLRIDIIKRGYRLLNEIGEQIRNETIMYSVTATSSGEGVDVSGLTKTWTLTLDQFLEYGVSFSSSRMIMKKNSTLFNALNKTNFEAFEWSSQRKEAYEFFIKKIRNFSQYKKINRGNLLEGFFNWTDKISSGEKPIHFLEALQQSLGNKAFFRGGDIKNIQVKGPNASVTNISTLISAIQETKNILCNPNYILKGINQEIKSQVDSLQVDKKIEENIDKIARNLLKKFGG